MQTAHAWLNKKHPERVLLACCLRWQALSSCVNRTKVERDWFTQAEIYNTIKADKLENYNLMYNVVETSSDKWRGLDMQSDVMPIWNNSTKKQSLKTADRMEQAWNLFMRDGVVDSSIVRPEIANSWRRCYKQGRKSGLVPQSVLKEHQKSNELLIEVSKPVISDLVNMMNKQLDSFSVMLLDAEGVVIHRINYNNNIVTLGHLCDERHRGTSGPALAIANNVGTEVVGYEHLYPNAHHWHTIGVPIRDGDMHTVGVIALLNTTGQYIPLTMQIVSLAASIIESRLHRQKLLLDVSSTVMNALNSAAMLVNEQGIVVCANELCLNLLGTTPERLFGNNLAEHLTAVNNQDLLLTLASGDDTFYVPIKNRDSGCRHSNRICRVDRQIIQIEPRETLFMLTFKPMYQYLFNKSVAETDAFSVLAGKNKAFLKVIETARKAAGMNCNILIEGESGTGKELIAQAIHRQSARPGRFVAVNSGAIPKELWNSELFGYEEGAFTGAKKGGNPGKFELAHKGTLFLDEIAEMPLPMQVSLLRLLEDKTVTRLGGKDSRIFDVRVIAATNRNLMNEVRNGSFREDLFYRLNVVYLKVPPLRERKDDIPILAELMLQRCCSKNNMSAPQIDRQVIDVFCDYNWPGNVRQLQNVMECSLIQDDDGVITRDDLPSYLLEDSNSATKAGKLQQVEETVIREALQRNNGNISQTARELGITRKTLYRKMKKIANG